MMLSNMQNFCHGCVSHNLNYPGLFTKWSWWVSIATVMTMQKTFYNLFLMFGNRFIYIGNYECIKEFVNNFVLFKWVRMIWTNTGWIQRLGNNYLVYLLTSSRRIELNSLYDKNIQKWKSNFMNQIRFVYK